MLYVIILSAALDLVGPSIPKGVVLLADVLPSFLVKLTAPYYIHVLSHPVRVLIFVLLSAGGMLIVALTPEQQTKSSVLLRLFGVALASLSSGGGELSFLGLTHHYDDLSNAGIASWSSGTGAAGLVGAGAYVLATTTLDLSSRTTLLAFAFLPVIMLISFFFVLPGTVKSPTAHGDRVGYQRLPNQDVHDALDGGSSESEDSPEVSEPQAHIPQAQKPPSTWQTFKCNLHRTRNLFIP